MHGTEKACSPGTLRFPRREAKMRSTDSYNVELTQLQEGGGTTSHDFGGKWLLLPLRSVRVTSTTYANCVGNERQGTPPNPARGQPSRMGCIA
jgi:hypothetical protein